MRHLTWPCARQQLTNQDFVTTAMGRHYLEHVGEFYYPITGLVRDSPKINNRKYTASSCIGERTAINKTDDINVLNKLTNTALRLSFCNIKIVFKACFQAS